MIQIYIIYFQQILSISLRILTGELSSFFLAYSACLLGQLVFILGEILALSFLRNNDAGPDCLTFLLCQVTFITFNCESNLLFSCGKEHAAFALLITSCPKGTDVTQKSCVQV